MVRFTVLWREDLIDKLATLWATYHSRGELSAAVDQLDVALSVDAHLKGIRFKADQKSLGRGPITVFFRVDEGDRKVLVESISFTEVN